MNPMHRKATELLRRRSEPQQGGGLVPQKRPEMPKTGGDMLGRMRQRVRGAGPTPMKRPPGM